MGGRVTDLQLRLEDLGTSLFATTFAVVDLETTGTSPTRDRITEVGAVRARGGEVLAELRTYVHPGTPIPAAITALTGITDADVRDAPRIEQLLPTVLSFLDGAVLVAHNARFDLGFLRAAAERSGLPEPCPVVIDTVTLARRLVRSEVRDLRLATLAAHLRSPVAPDHRALSDARATLHVLHALIERAHGLGVVTLEDLVELATVRGERSRRRIDLVRDAPSAPGVYRFVGADGALLYVGTAVDLRRRLRTYFGSDPRRHVADLVRATDRVTWTTTATSLEAGVLEVRELHAHRPRYNRRSTRPSAAVAVALTREPFPRLALTRALDGGHRRVLGPVPSRSTAEAAIEAVLEVVPLRACRPRLRRRQDHDACMLKDLHRCGAPCDGTQTPDAYAAVVAGVEASLDDPSGLIAALRARMVGLAERGDFERAAEVRARSHALVRLLDATRRWTRLVDVARLVASRPSDKDPDVLEVVVVTHGRLAASWTVDAATGSDPWPGTVDPSVAPPSLDPSPAFDPAACSDVEEVTLVATWLERPGVVVLHVDGVLATPLAGGAALSAAVTEAGRVDRALRQDADAIGRRKVLRRDGPEAPAPGPAAATVEGDRQTISNHGPSASGSVARPPGSRPSQVARTR
jgi:DNA polymerase III subunit epsilon